MEAASRDPRELGMYIIDTCVLPNGPCNQSVVTRIRYRSKSESKRKRFTYLSLQVLNPRRGLPKKSRYQCHHGSPPPIPQQQQLYPQTCSYLIHHNQPLPGHYLSKRLHAPPTTTAAWQLYSTHQSPYLPTHATTSSLFAHMRGPFLAVGRCVAFDSRVIISAC